MTVHATPPPRYRGRFAPTPSGPLHHGSLLTALASWLDARSHGGQWLLRIDDLDRPRCVPGADRRILEQLEAHGLAWDEAPRYQSAHLNAYRAALDTLEQSGALYACRCTRAELAVMQHAGVDGPVYAGTCRSLHLPQDGNAWRFAIGAGTLTLDDGIQGLLKRDAAKDIGDFVVRRRDGIYGYHLACAIDEHAQGITDIVRGADLIGSTFAQLALMARLGRPAPRYAHVPVLLGTDGLKLSKQNHATAIDDRLAADNLRVCLRQLGQPAPEALSHASVAELLDWATRRWRLAAIAPRAVMTAAL